MTDFDQWWRRSTAADDRPPFGPHPWQRQLAEQSDCQNRLIRIPTGMGKTLGVLNAWLWHRLGKQDERWPRRLIWCLPMRALVDQTASEAHDLLANAGLTSQVDVYRLLGGADEANWYLHPDREAILIGTQDMLLSRALNRGYAMGRAAWPRAFGLVNSDSLWVMDEVQLMGVGLTTSAQIQAFWQSQQPQDGWLEPPRATWWMSATLQPHWLRSPETDSMVDDLTDQLLHVAAADRTGPTWDAQKKIQRIEAKPDQWPDTIAQQHQDHQPDPATGRQTLVVVNTVKQAVKLYETVTKQLKAQSKSSPSSDPKMPEVRLVHSRFRLHERDQWAKQFLSRGSLNPDVNRIIIATQVVEAGVDISASCLISEIAPWTSLVQRFGRAARYGGNAQITILDSHPDEKAAAPYLLDEIDGARDALQRLTDDAADVSIKSLEQFEEDLAANDPPLLRRLYPFHPLHVLLPHEFEELFDTSTDLSGGDMDVSRFIRQGDERDLKVFWRDLADDQPPHPTVQPGSEELCSVPIADAKNWVKKMATTRGLIWQWSYVDGCWENAQADRLRPGMILLVNSLVGGYHPDIGFTGEKPKKGAPALDVSKPNTMGVTMDDIDQRADRADGVDSLSEAERCKTIFTHNREAGDLAMQQADDYRLAERIAHVFDLTLRLHDWGKAHPAFAQGTYCVAPPRTDLAKAPPAAWRSLRQFYNTPTHGPRKGFRHELVSCLATLELLRQAQPLHPAILGEVETWFTDAEPTIANESLANHPLVAELAALSKDEFNLVLYLVVSHHGKVRLSLQASGKDQEFPFDDTNYLGVGMPIRGVREGDRLPPTLLPDSQGNPIEMPEVEIHLAPAAIGLSPRYGASWTERVIGLLDQYGSFRLGYWEALVRSIDTKASMLTSPDPALQGVNSPIPARPPAADEATTLTAAAIATDDTPDDNLIENQLTDRKSTDRAYEGNDV